MSAKDPLRLLRPAFVVLDPASERQAVTALMRLLAADALTRARDGGPMDDPASEEDAA